MAYRRKQGGITRSSSTFKEDSSVYHHQSSNDDSSSSSSLAAQAIRASAAHRDSSLSSAYANSNSSSFNHNTTSKASSSTYDYTSMKSTNEPGGIWGVLARKAKAILDEDKITKQSETPRWTKPQTFDTSTTDQLSQTRQSTNSGSSRKKDNPRLRKGFDAITSSLNRIGDSIETAFEEGRNIVGNKTADIIQETRKLQIRRKGTNAEDQSQTQDNQETQLKASRDVAMATAAKAKVLLREVKTIKADLAFAKERCSQLEEENRALREAGEKGDNPADDELIRLQLETLLAEKARLAHENSIYARENRFLREVVEYHQLTMQDVVYLDEGVEEVTEVYPVPAVSRMLSASPPSPRSPRSPAEVSSPSSSPSRRSKETLASPVPIPPPQAITDVPQSKSPPSNPCPVPHRKLLQQDTPPLPFPN
ncbi:hypothetical protein LguiA_016518 [Lonicera macranthoides]